MRHVALDVDAHALRLHFVCVFGQRDDDAFISAGDYFVMQSVEN